jgi:hypothetical protein
MNNVANLIVHSPPSSLSLWDTLFENLNHRFGNELTNFHRRSQHSKKVKIKPVDLLLSEVSVSLFIAAVEADAAVVSVAHLAHFVTHVITTIIANSFCNTTEEHTILVTKVQTAPMQCYLV